VLHEPALGPRAAGVHALLAGLAERVAPLAPPDALAAVVAAMLGADARPNLPEGAYDDAASIVTEVPSFARFAPSDDDFLRGRGVPLTTTVGAGSPPARAEAAAALAAAMGAEVVEVPGSAHLAQLDAPGFFADRVREMVANT
jgi:pimeloyl-ACP methyl ester carboxylesterase